MGQHIGNYHLIRLLGAGGFAQVYLGEHLYLKSQTAIKLLETRLSQDEVDRFLHEAQILARLIHPHIVRVLEGGVEDTTPFLVMDYAPGGTLRQRHPTGTVIPPGVVLSYVSTIASALQYAHEHHPSSGLHYAFASKNLALEDAFLAWPTRRRP